MIWWLVAWKFLRSWAPVIGKLLWKHRDIVLLIILVIVLLNCCGGGKETVIKDPPIKEILVEKPNVRYSTPSDSLTKHIYDSIYALFRDSFDVVTVRRDSLIFVDGDTIVITDSVEIEVPRCWNQYHKLLASHTATNTYIDTIYVVDSTKRRLRRLKCDTTLVLYLTEDVQLNQIKLRRLSYQDFRTGTQQNKRIRFYGGVLAGGNKGFGHAGPSFLIAGNRLAGGYVYLIRLPFEDSHNALLYYRLSK